jgi:hypothetical protein
VPFIIVEFLNSLPRVRVICVQFNMAFLPLLYTTSIIKLIKNVPFSKVVLTNVGLKRLQVCMNAVEHVCILQLHLISIVVCLVHARNRTFKVKSWSSIKLKVWLHASHTLFVLYGLMTQVCCNKVGHTGEPLPVMPQF